jgi:hypothetical protein
MELDEFSKIIANTESTVNPIFFTGNTMFKLFAIPLRKIVNFSFKFKDFNINSGLVRAFIFIIVITFWANHTAAQVEFPIKNPAQSLPIKGDTSKFAADTLVNWADTVKITADTIKIPPPKKGDIETTINYTAKDSIRASMDGKMIWLYGEAKIKYGSIELEAEEVIIDYANNTIEAQGRRDSLGNRIGYPIFKNGSELYETKGIIYNFKTGRARITEVVTQQGEGYLHSDAAFKNEKNEILSVRNSYTTCNLEHPHFRIRATKTKAIPNDKIVAGPFYMEFNDIPLPIGFLFGMFPAQRESKSGIIFPSYGEERIRGFNLRHGGYFFDINDYVKLAVTGDIYSKGGHALNANSNYMKRYAYNGSFNFSYSKNRLSENIEDRSVSNDFRLTWSHTPQSKGTGRFSASVNASTSTFNRYNNLMYGTPGEYNTSSLNNTTAGLNSNISYSKRFSGTPFTLGMNMRHNQNLRTRLVDLSLPDISLTMTNLYPFQQKSKTGPLDNFSIGYNMNATNQITNNLGKIIPGVDRDSIAAFNSANLPLFFRLARNGMQHSLPVSYSFKALKYFTVTPSFSYNERWYTKKLDWTYNEQTKTFAQQEIDGFSRSHNYSVSTGLTTRFYGMYFFNKKNSSIKAIRHIANPSLSLSYTPDFRQMESNFQEFKTGMDTTTSKGIFQYKGRHDGFAYGSAPAGGEASNLSFSLSNNLEAKIKSAKDTAERKVMLLNNLSISTSYNLMADSFNLAPIGINANTSILDNKINVSLSATLDPYNYAVTYTQAEGSSELIRHEKRRKYYALPNGSLGRITSANLSLNTNLNPQMRKKENATREKISKADIPEEQKQYMLKNPNLYIDFDIPWSMNLMYNLTYNHGENQKKSFTQNLQASGDLSISEKWKITYNTGYDFKAKQFTPTNLGISRDLHCWTMNLMWVPFGLFQSYNFTIAVKASVLRDLKLERRKPFQDNL